MTRTAAEFETAHEGDVLWHRKLMTPSLREADQADLLVAGRVEGGDLTGLRIETPGGAVELSVMQIAGLLDTLALASPEQFLNVTGPTYDRDHDHGEPDAHWHAGEYGRHFHVEAFDGFTLSGIRFVEDEEEEEEDPAEVKAQATWDAMLGPVEDGDLMQERSFPLKGEDEAVRIAQPEDEAAFRRDFRRFDGIA